MWHLRVCGAVRGFLNVLIPCSPSLVPALPAYKVQVVDLAIFMAEKSSWISQLG